MKRLRAILLMLIFVMASFLLTGIGSKIQAAGGADTYLTLTASNTSATADGKSKITLTVFVYRLNCPGNVAPSAGANCEDGSTPTHKGLPGREVWFSSSAAVLFEGTYPCLDGQPCVKSGEDGKAQLMVSSATAGTKGITGRVDIGWGNIDPASVSLTFKAVAAPAPAKPKAPTAAPAPAPAPVVEKPAAPTVATITIGGEEIKDNKSVSIAASEPLVLSGKTIPNGKVAVYVFSDPKLFETTADAEGNWSVKVEGLPEGNHHAEVEVTNPANNQKSDRTKLLEFSVVADKKLSPMPVEQTSSKAGLWLGIAAAALVLLAIVGFLLWKRKQKKAKSNDDFSNPNPPAVTPSDSDTSSDSDSSDAPSSSSDNSPSSPSDDSPTPQDGR